MSSDGSRLEKLIQQSIVSGDRPSDWRRRKKEELPDDYEPSPKESTLENSYSALLQEIEASTTVDNIGDYLEENHQTLRTILEKLEESREKHNHFGLVNFVLGGGEEEEDEGSPMPRREFMGRSAKFWAGSLAAGAAAGAGAAALMDEKDSITTVDAPQEYEKTYLDDNLIQKVADRLAERDSDTLVNAGSHMQQEMNEEPYKDYELGFLDGSMYLDEGTRATRYRLDGVYREAKQTAESVVT